MSSHENMIGFKLSKLKMILNALSWSGGVSKIRKFSCWWWLFLKSFSSFPHAVFQHFHFRLDEFDIKIRQSTIWNRMLFRLSENSSAKSFFNQWIRASFLTLCLWTIQSLSDYRNLSPSSSNVERNQNICNWPVLEELMPEFQYTLVQK